MIDITKNQFLVPDIQQAIEEYFLENKQQAIFNGEKQDVIYISGMADKHNPALANYLNSSVLKSYPAKADICQGHFANYPIIHCWIKIGNLIIDLVIKQFADKNIDFPENLLSLLDKQYFICDNPSNPFYKLYISN